MNNASLVAIASNNVARSSSKRER